MGLFSICTGFALAPQNREFLVAAHVQGLQWIHALMCV
jgi:hypothetical protein